MAKRSRCWNQSLFEKYLREGRGRGNGPGYTPWIRIQDFASKGVVSRVKGRTTGRVHHLMSNNELAYFYLLDWSDNVLDIREQYPLLDLECAMNTAAQAGINYPVDRASGYPYVMTCDFLVTTVQGFKARTVKHSSELANSRTLEKLEIERRYWDRQNIEWKLVTENEIDYRKAKNIEWLYSGQSMNGIDTLSGDFNLALDFLKRVYSTTHLPILEIVKMIEDEFSYTAGFGIAIFKNLVLQRGIEIELSNAICLKKPRAEVA